MNRIKKFWNDQTNLERFVGRNLLWGILCLVVGFWGENNYLLIGIALLLIYVPGMLVEFAKAFGKDLRDKIEEDELKRYRQRFEG